MKLAAVVLILISTLTGCASEETLLHKATDLRKRILESEACVFHAVITADYVEAIYTFQMDCTADQTGKMSFTVTDPETIAGISGAISENQSELTFDDQVLVFPMLSEGQLTPVSAPWIFLNTLRGGYLTGCSKEGDGFCIYIDDSYEEYPLHLLIQTDKDMVPVFAEIIWQEQRVLSIDVRNFSLQ